MTITDSPPAETAVAEEPVEQRQPAGIYSLLTTSDHKTIGRMFIACAVLLAFATSVLGVLIGLEQVDTSRPDDIFGGLNAYFQMWTLYRVAFVLVVAMPLMLGIAMVVVPIQVGATSIAFPRAALASFWSWLLGAGTTVVSVFAGGGWGALDGVTADERDAIALTLAGTVFSIVALLAGALCVATTVISLRTAGMNLMRVPVFAWSMLVAASIWLLTLPVAVANIVLIYVDLRGRDPIAFGIPSGAEGGIWAQIDWVFTQPTVYSLAIPALGLAAGIVPVAAKVRQAQHAVLVAAIGLLGLLSIGGWAQPFMTAPVDHRDEILYVGFGLGALLPVLVVLGGTGDSIRRGLANLIGIPTTMLLGAVGSVLLIGAGVLAGALRVIEPFELLDRTTTSAVFEAVLIGVLLAAVAGLWYWAPKILGTTLPERTGRLSALALIGGGLLVVAPDVISGFFLADDLLAAEAAENVVEPMNVVSLIGSVVVAVGLLGVVAAVAGAARPGRPSPGDDPWGGHTLEWATTSPPPLGNFAEPPARVESEAPLLDQHEPAALAESTGSEGSDD